MNKNLMFSKGKDLAINATVSNVESQSVVSVISKGGTVFNPFLTKRNSN